MHTVKGFSVVNEAEVDVFLELSCFFYDPVAVGNLISGSSAFSKFSLNIWNFSVHGLLKPLLENFEHCFASMWDEYNCAVVWTFFGIAFLWDWNENWTGLDISKAETDSVDMGLCESMEWFPLLSFPLSWNLSEKTNV